MLKDDVYNGSVNFHVYVLFDGEHLCGASLISSQNALAPYMEQFQRYLYHRLLLMVPTAADIYNIEYDMTNSLTDKFAVISVSIFT